MKILAKLKRRFILNVLLCALLLSACTPLTFNVKVDAKKIGVLGENNSTGSVATPDDVKVYVQTAPEGFLMEDNVLRVVEGYQHKVIASLKAISMTEKIDGVMNKSALCTAEGYGKLIEMPSETIVYKQLKKAAFEVGANAIIFAYSTIPEEFNRQSCAVAYETNDWGGGWAVFVK